MKGRAKGLARRFGLEVSRGSGNSTMEAAFRRLAPRIPVRSVIDVGASDGRWSELVLRSYPNASFLLVEAQANPHGAGLRAFASAHANVDFVIAAAGDHEGEIHFDAGAPFGGVASTEVTGPNDLVVPMTTIDAEVARREMAPPFLLKLDTHGFEVPILTGATDTLARTELLVVESYNFELMPGCLRFHEMCAHLDERGFRPIDLVDVLRRPGDSVLWQFDLFFARKDRPEFASATYR